MLVQVRINTFSFDDLSFSKIFGGYETENRLCGEWGCRTNKLQNYVCIYMKGAILMSTAFYLPLETILPNYSCVFILP